MVVIILKRSARALQWKLSTPIISMSLVHSSEKVACSSIKNIGGGMGVERS